MLWLLGEEIRDGLPLKPKKAFNAQVMEIANQQLFVEFECIDA